MYLPLMSRTQLAADVIRTASGKHMAPPTAAIIVAAGQSTRMKGVSKQFLQLDGVPVLVHTLRAFQRSRYIDEIVLVVRKEDEERVRLLVREYRITKLTHIVQGGKTRQESAKRGFAAIHKSMRYVAIHDGARCLVTPDMIKSVLREAYKTGAASAASAVTDTVKLANKRGFIDKTLDRDRVFLVSTPQAFNVDLYYTALEKIGKKDFTDDNQLMEHIGIPVKLVDVGKENVKITTSEDVPFAEYLLQRRNKA